MGALNRIGLFCMILFFSGSIVIVGARDLHKHLRKQTDEDRERAKRLVQALQGEVLLESKEKYVPPQKWPSRTAGGVLPDGDKGQIKSLLRSVFGSDTEKSDAKPESGKQE